MASNNISVHVGVWRDYSQDGLNQVILTIPLQWGNILISVLALLLSVAGAATWRTAAFFVHQYRCLRVRDGSSDSPLQQQVQVLLRNNATPISALADILHLQRAWSQVRTRRSPLRTLLPTASLAAVITIVFTLLGIFVSAFATRSESNVTVLATPGESCGGWKFNWAKVAITDALPSSFETLRARTDDVLSARAYANWFYSRGKQPLAATSSTFPVSRLPYTTTSGPCPFLGNGRCLSNDTSTLNITLVLDTGLLDSHTHLGMNAPRRDRSSIRHRMACSPIDVSDRIKILDPVNGTVEVDTSALFDSPTGPSNFSTNPEQLRAGYSATSYWWPGATKGLQWPSWLYTGSDADITACMVSQGSVRYTEPVYDPLFLANGSKFTSPYYYGNNHFNVLACEQQVQFCNPTTGRCTNLTHAAQAYNESTRLGLSPTQFTSVERSAVLLGLTDVGILGVGTLGASGLLARESVFSDTLSLHLPEDQWKREAALWFETKLALLQAHTLRFLDRIDLSSPIYQNMLIYQPMDSLPKGSEERAAVDANCRNLRITTSGRYQNFQLWGVMLVIILSVLIIGVSMVLEPCARLVRSHWVTHEGQIRQLARDMDGQYWLVRIALEGAGVGPWRRGGSKADGSIPVVDVDRDETHGLSLVERPEHVVQVVHRDEDVKS
ncbi:hypothetical protein QBC39DRAFT_31541 [Podospora conica]|nr:hypothetical protein QBC39DRAFT_31541 [Schizothecium conicum]